MLNANVFTAAACTDQPISVPENPSLGTGLVTQRGMAEVCKTFTRGFDSPPRLQLPSDSNTSSFHNFGAAFWGAVCLYSNSAYAGQTRTQPGEHVAQGRTNLVHGVGQ